MKFLMKFNVDYSYNNTEGNEMKIKTKENMMMKNEKSKEDELDKMFDFQQDLNIDPNSLDCEWIEQPQRFMKYAEAATEAYKRRELLKDQLDLIKSQLDQEIRANAINNGEKITEAVVSSRITQDERFQEKNRLLLEAEYNLELMQYAVRAMDQRKIALENLVRLFGMEYFSGPKAPENIGEKYKTWIEKRYSREKIKSRLQRQK